MLQNTIERPRPTRPATARTAESQRQHEYHESLVREAHESLVREAHEREMQEAAKHVRVLLHREQWYAVRTAQLATVLAHTLRRYTGSSTMPPERVAYAVLATFDARCHAGDLPREGHDELGRRCAEAASAALSASPGEQSLLVPEVLLSTMPEDVQAKTRPAGGAGGARQADADVRAVTEALSSSLGRQCRVTGWLPGVVIMDGKVPVSLTGDACPSCGTNPVVQDRSRPRAHSRCLNREDCGWDARPKPRKRQKKKPSRDRIDS